MYRPALRSVAAASLPRALPRNASARRFLTTAPRHKLSRSWKNSALRWGLAGTLVYYYNTSDVFADEPALAVHAPPETPSESEQYASIDSIASQRRAQARSQSQSSLSPSADPSAPPAGSADELEEQAGQQGAFNEETGEINWDCPCLGGMAHGPCGEQFRTAFSCFVFSKEDPKGVDCIEHFKGMQDCFREHPDIYGAELEDTEEGVAAGEGSAAPASQEGEKVAKTKQAPAVEAAKSERAESATQQVKQDFGSPTSESEHAVPKAWYDTTDANTAK